MVLTTVNDTQPKQTSLRERLGVHNPDGSVNWLNALIYGEPSSGKTFLFGTIVEWPEEFLPALLIDIDGGTDTLRHHPQIDISPPVRSSAALKKIYDEVAKEPDYYKTIGIDNASEYQKIDMNEVMQEAKTNANDPSKVNIYAPSQREWGINGERMRITIRSFKDLPCHTLCFAHVSEREDKLTKVHGIWPGMPGQMRHEILGFFSVGGYLSVYEEGGDVFRQIQFKKTRRVQVRDRFQVLPDLMKDNPTIPQIWKIIKDSGAKIVENDPLQIPNAPAPQLSATQQLQGAISQ
jgi:hypothetical protein